VCLGTLVQDGFAHTRGVTWRAVPAKFKTGMYEMKILGSVFLRCIFGTFVQDVSGLAPMRGVIWRAAPAKFKTGMCEMKILGSEVFVVCLCNIRSGLAHMRGVICSGKVQNRDV